MTYQPPPESDGYQPGLLPPRPGNNATVITLVVVAVLVLGGAAAIFLLNKGNNPTPTSSTAAATAVSSTGAHSGSITGTKPTIRNHSATADPGAQTLAQKVLDAFNKKDANGFISLVCANDQDYERKFTQSPDSPFSPSSQGTYTLADLEAPVNGNTGSMIYLASGQDGKGVGSLIMDNLSGPWQICGDAA